MNFEHPDYADVRPLAKGGQAVVYRARHVPLDRSVAVKVLRDAGDDETVERLLQEARLVARLRHPNLVQVYDAGTLGDGRPYVVMECVEGSTLQRLSGSVPTALAVRLVAQVAGALGAAHAIGVVHRDVKPSNILLDGEEDNPVAKLADFGIAHVEDSEITSTGIALGTPSYMAPEGFRGHAEPASDVYALGLILHLLLTGKRPFEARSAAAWMARHLSHERPKLPDDLDIPDSLRTLHDQMVALEPEDRPQDGKAVERALMRVLGELEPTLSVPLHTSSGRQRTEEATDTVSVRWLGLGAAALTTGGLLLAGATLVVGVGLGAVMMSWSHDMPADEVEAAVVEEEPVEAVQVEAPPEDEAEVDDLPEEVPEAVEAEPPAPSEDGVAAVPEPAAEAPVEEEEAAAVEQAVVEAEPVEEEPGEDEDVEEEPVEEPVVEEPAVAAVAPEPEPEPVFPGGTFRGEASGRPLVLSLSGGESAVSADLELKVGARSEMRKLTGRAAPSGGGWSVELAEQGGDWTLSGMVSGGRFQGTIGMGGRRTMKMEATQ